MANLNDLMNIVNGTEPEPETESTPIPEDIAPEHESEYPELLETSLSLTLNPLSKAIFETVPESKGAAVRFTTTDDDVALFNAVNGNSDPVKLLIGKELEVSDMIITSAEVHEGRTPDGEQDENTPIVSKPCVHFYTPTGEHYTTLSNGIARAARNLISVGFAPNPEHTIVIRFRTIDTKKGTAHTFDLVKRNT